MRLPNEIVRDAVMKTSQTYVNNVKEIGEFDVEPREVAFIMAKTTALEILGEGGIAFLKQAVGDVHEFPNHKIEAVVLAQKSL
jgi:hypothetical protein